MLCVPQMEWMTVEYMKDVCELRINDETNDTRCVSNLSNCILF